MDFKDFVLSICNKPRNFKIKGSWGVYDAYKLMRKNHWYEIGNPVTEKDFYAIIRQVNKLMLEELIKGNTIKFPAKMGKLELRKFERSGAKIVNGKLKIYYPIDWMSTYKLWYEDEEAKKKNILIRFDGKYHYKILYLKHDATYENKLFYQFFTHMPVRKKLKESIKEGKTETLW